MATPRAKRKPAPKPAIRRARHPAKPTPGWKGWDSGLETALVNPRAPAVPATLRLNLEKYYIGATLMGAVAGQTSEPDKEWLSDFAIDLGIITAKKVRRLWPDAVPKTKGRRRR